MMRNSVSALQHATLVAALVAVLGFAGEVHAGDLEHARDEARLGVATVFANVFYVPAKLGYAAIGGLTGGIGYLVTGGSRHVAEKIWVSSLGGDYILTESMVAGDKQIRFSGGPPSMISTAAR